MKMPDWLLRSLCVGIVLWSSMGSAAEARELEWRECDCYERSAAVSYIDQDRCQFLPTGPGEYACPFLTSCTVNTTTNTMIWDGYCAFQSSPCQGPTSCGLD
jgi:hypothetical protein